MNKPRTILAFDYGQRRIGVAVGQELTRSASALTTLVNPKNGPDWTAIGKIIEQWRPQLILLGLPVNLDGSAHALTHAVQGFGEDLKSRYNLPVECIDERLSSHEAETLLREGRAGSSRPTQRGDIDKLAAALILQSWLNQLPNKETH